MRFLFRAWFLSFIFLTLICGLVYITGQQAYRHSADDPQLQMAHDTSLLLSQNGTYQSSKPRDIASTYAPFTIIYDMQGKIVTSEAMLNGQNPRLPSGVLDYVKMNGLDRFTWEPQSGVRIATIVTRASWGYVLVGRSLYTVEQRETQLEQQVALFWILSNIIMLAVITGTFYRKK